MAFGPKPTDPVVRFWSHVNKSDGCWEWTKGLGRRGYGKFAASHGHSISAHRFAWVATYGEVPNGLFVLHNCDNVLCVRPDHLHLGTHKDNMREGVERNRFKCGSTASWSHLTEEAVTDIRTSSLTQWALAHKYGVTQAAVWRAQRGFTWRHVKQLPIPNKQIREEN